MFSKVLGIVITIIIIIIRRTPRVHVVSPSYKRTTWQILC